MITNEWTIELEKLRKQNAALKADAVRLAGSLTGLLLNEHDGDSDWVYGDKTLNQHNDLMEEIDGQK